mmetsp:Transcript_37869/g.100846  ORF Transcript_37869/g.100846 Transcript_37869/m.100846 type:complete len:233 (+) Transcript_37869:653-1351(+)
MEGAWSRRPHWGRHAPQARGTPTVHARLPLQSLGGWGLLSLSLHCLSPGWPCTRSDVWPSPQRALHREFPPQSPEPCGTTRSRRRHRRHSATRAWRCRGYPHSQQRPGQCLESPYSDSRCSAKSSAPQEAHEQPLQSASLHCWSAHQQMLSVSEAVRCKRDCRCRAPAPATKPSSQLDRVCPRKRAHPAIPRQDAVDPPSRRAPTRGLWKELAANRIMFQSAPNFQVFAMMR